MSEVFVSLSALIFMEVVLGIDNIVFIAILVEELPKKSQNFARNLGISISLILRILLLFAVSWIMSLTKPWITVFNHSISGRDMILLLGGIFLITKASHEIYKKIELSDEEQNPHVKKPTFGWVIAQIVLLDLVFSLDSVITAVGMVKELWMMITAVVIAMAVMLIFAKSVADFISKYPSLKILSLSFLILIGVLLTSEGLHQHINRGYIYFAMFFSLAVEFVNIQVRKPRLVK